MARSLLITRHPRKYPTLYAVVLDWMRGACPELLDRFEFRLLPFSPVAPADYLLHIPWLQDPVEQWSPEAYRDAVRLTDVLDQAGVPTVNRVDRLRNAGKAKGAELIGSVGIRTPRAALITNTEEFKDSLFGIEPPLLVREDWGHSSADALRTGKVVYCGDRRAAQRVALRGFARPVAMEFIDTRTATDGLYRKYRYVAAGDIGVPHHLHVQEHWFVKGADQLYSASIRDEDASYLGRPDPNHELLQKARRALGLDFVAFDYSYDRDGRLVVWEANPSPYFHFIGGRRAYRTPAVERTFAAMLALYHVRSGDTVPDMLARFLAYPERGTPAPEAG